MAARAEGPVSVRTDPAPQALYLHVGLPKTGTTFLQNVLKHHREVLEENGFCYPFVRKYGMFSAAAEMTGTASQWGLDEAEIEGTFDSLLAEGRRHGGTVVLSHEGFGRASPEQVAEIARRTADFEVHLVLTVRDIGRTLSAAWQERIKNGGTRSFREYADTLAGLISEEGEPQGGFWPAQNVEGVLRRWGALCPPERTHVVICPQSGAPTGELWNRFGAALGIPREIIDLDVVETHNESLGAPQIALLRQVNQVLEESEPPPGTARTVKRWLAQEILNQVPARRAVAPTDVLQRFEPVGRRWTELLAGGGHQCYGDLEDLRLRLPGPGTPHPDDVTAEELVEGLPQAVAELLVRASRQSAINDRQQRKIAAQGQRIEELRRRTARLRGELADAQEELRLRRRFWPFRVGPQKRA